MGAVEEFDFEKFKKSWEAFKDGAERHQWNEDIVNEVGEDIDNLIEKIESMEISVQMNKASADYSRSCARDLLVKLVVQGKENKLLKRELFAALKRKEG